VIGVIGGAFTITLCPGCRLMMVVWAKIIPERRNKQKQKRFNMHNIIAAVTLIFQPTPLNLRN
jgi:hypothetical protein